MWSQCVRTRGCEDLEERQMLVLGEKADGEAGPEKPFDRSGGIRFAVVVGRDPAQNQLSSELAGFGKRLA